MGSLFLRGVVNLVALLGLIGGTKLGIFPPVAILNGILVGVFVTVTFRFLGRRTRSRFFVEL